MPTIEQSHPNAERFTSAMNHFAEGLQELSEMRVHPAVSAIVLGYTAFHFAKYFYELDLIPAAHFVSSFTPIAALFPISIRISGQSDIPFSSDVLPLAARGLRTTGKFVVELFKDNPIPPGSD